MAIISNHNLRNQTYLVSHHETKPRSKHGTSNFFFPKDIMQVVYATSTAWVVNYQAVMLIAEATNSKLAGEVSGELTRVGI